MASATSMPVQGPKIMANSSLSKVLQSESVRRLFNQPNIVIHAIPRTNSPTAFRMVSPKSLPAKTHEMNGECQQPNNSEIINNNVNRSNTDVPGEENLLPSKNNGKSEILLVPIVRKRKECGHFEPCESMICNVTVQHYENDDECTPLISINISDEEIDAPAQKHCENNKCDALSIDHNRCRRASISLHRCDKCFTCDICGIKFESHIARLNHKKCRRKDIYQHNTVSPSDILKFRMRERELQILEAARLKRSSDYLDPVTGFSRTMEALTKNDELIIIPKMRPPHSKVVMPCFPPLSSLHNNKNYNNNNHYNSIKSILANKRVPVAESNKELTSEMISRIILSCQNSINSKNQNEKASSIPSKQIKLSDHFNGATVNIMDTPSVTNQQTINMTEMTSNIVNTVKSLQLKSQSVNEKPSLNCVNSDTQEQSMTNNSGPQYSNVNADSLKQINVDKWVTEQSNTTPLKIEPVAEIKSKPTELQEIKGVPNVCIMPEPSAEPSIIPEIKTPYEEKKLIPKEKKSAPPPLIKLTPKTVQILNSGKFRPLQPALCSNVRNVDIKLASALLIKKQKPRKRSRKNLLKKGKFRCTHCPKRFSSIDYCRIHISKHENNPGFFCKVCELGFLNKGLMNKHISDEHKPGETRCEMCFSVLPSVQELVKHMKCPETKVELKCSECSNSFNTCNGLDIHMRKEHGFLICTLCKRQVTKTKMKRHLMLEHSISKNRSETGFEKLSYPPSANDKISEMIIVGEDIIKVEPSVKTELVNENKIETDCLARNRSIRRRNSKEFFVCNVCDRRFENEKQFQIHLANNPMKFTLCPDCGKKFHRKSEYTEHSKTCNWNTLTSVEQTPKRRKISHSGDEIVLKKSNDNVTQNSIEQKQNEIVESKTCKKLHEEKNVQKTDNENTVKKTIEIKISNGLKPVSSNCLKGIKIIKVEKIEKIQILKREDKQVLPLSVNQTQTNSSESADLIEKSRILSSINQDHNYQALQ